MPPKSPEQISTASTPTVPFGAYYASAAGGRVRFSASTDYVMINDEGVTDLALFVNPPNSGVDCYLDIGEFGASFDARFRRLGGFAHTIPDVSAGPLSRNTGGGSQVAACRLYRPGQYTVSGGDVRKTAYMRASTNYITMIEGRSVVRPGNALAWTIQATRANIGGRPHGFVHLEWIELPAAS